MTAVGIKEYDACYMLGLAYHRGQISFKDALDHAVSKLDMKEATAGAYIKNLQSIIEGRTYKRTISLGATTHYLREIYEDLGIVAFKKAIQAVEGHIAYLENHKHSIMSNYRDAIEDIKARSFKDTLYKDQSALFQQSISQSLSDNETDRLARLAKADKTPEKKLVLVSIYKRNPDVVAQALLNAKSICQRCCKPAPFYRADDTPFLEVHHIVPLAKGGLDSIENAIAICPNCHREAHFGASPVSFSQ